LLTESIIKPFIKLKREPSFAKVESGKKGI